MKIVFKCVIVALVFLLTMWLLNAGFALVSSPSTLNVILGVSILAVVFAATISLILYWGKLLTNHIAKMALLVALAWTATGCGSTIPPGYVGIVVNSYGDNRGVQSYTAKTGRVWYNPVTTTVFEYPTFVQSVVFSRSLNEGKAVNEEITFTNADQMSISADVSLSYSIKVDKVPAFYVKFRSDDLNSFTYNYLHNLMRDKFNETAGKYTIAQIMGDNGGFLKEVKEALQADLEPIGVTLEQQFGFVGAPRPPQTVIDSINMKATANQIALQKQTELVQVQADAQKEVAKAEGHARAVIAAADADARANRIVSESLTDKLIALKQLEKWKGDVPQVTGSGGIPFVNLQTGK